MFNIRQVFKKKGLPLTYTVSFFFVLVVALGYTNIYTLKKLESYQRAEMLNFGRLIQPFVEKVNNEDQQSGKYLLNDGFQNIEEIMKVENRLPFLLQISLIDTKDLYYISSTNSSLINVKLAQGLANNILTLQQSSSLNRISYSDSDEIYQAYQLLLPIVVNVDTNEKKKEILQILFDSSYYDNILHQTRLNLIAINSIVSVVILIIAYLISNNASIKLMYVNTALQNLTRGVFNFSLPRARNEFNIIFQNLMLIKNLISSQKDEIKQLEDSTKDTIHFSFNDEKNFNKQLVLCGLIKVELREIVMYNSEKYELLFKNMLSLIANELKQANASIENFQEHTFMIIFQSSDIEAIHTLIRIRKKINAYSEFQKYFQDNSMELYFVIHKGNVNVMTFYNNDIRYKTVYGSGYDSLKTMIEYGHNDEILVSSQLSLESIHNIPLVKTNDTIENSQGQIKLYQVSHSTSNGEKQRSKKELSNELTDGRKVEKNSDERDFSINTMLEETFRDDNSFNS